MPQLDGTTIGIIGTIVGTVIGVSATVIVFFLQKKNTLLQYHIFRTLLITEKTAGILNNRISIDGQPISSLFETRIKFRNAGNQPINSSDFASQEPLRILLLGHLYGFDVFTGNHNLLPSLKRIDNMNLNIVNLNIIFEGLKPKKYFTVTILHDGFLGVHGVLIPGEMRPYYHK